MTETIITALITGGLTLLGALPPGQVKQLLKDEVCAAILNKYGIGEGDG